MSRPVYIVDGARTPFPKARGGYAPFTPVDLAVQCGRPLLPRQKFTPTDFDQVILGCVNVIADEANPARFAALRLGCGTQMLSQTTRLSEARQTLATQFNAVEKFLVLRMDVRNWLNLQRSNHSLHYQSIRN